MDPSQYLSLYPAAFAPLKSEFNLPAISSLFDAVDFIGISSYPSLSPSFTVNQIESATYQFATEIASFGVNITDLIFNKVLALASPPLAVELCVPAAVLHADCVMAPTCLPHHGCLWQCIMHPVCGHPRSGGLDQAHCTARCSWPGRRETLLFCIAAWAMERAAKPWPEQALSWPCGAGQEAVLE